MTVDVRPEIAGVPDTPRRPLSLRDRYVEAARGASG